MTSSRALPPLLLVAISLAACHDWSVGARPSETGDAARDAAGTEGGDASESLTSGLVAHWTFDDGAGTVVKDSSGNGNHASIVGAPTWVAGKSGSAVAFDGGDSYVEAISLKAPAFPIDQGSLSLWLMSSFAGDFRPVFESVGLRRRIAVRNSIAGKLQVFGPGDDAGVAFSDTFDVPTSVWTHVAIVWDFPAQQVLTYRDGALVSSVTDVALGFRPDGQELTFGKRAGASGYVGSLDEVRLYDRPLSPNEILALP